jgi:hypothetical protein
VTRTGTPMLALAPGHAPGTGAGTGHVIRPVRTHRPLRRFTAASALDRARDGWLITRLVQVPPIFVGDPGLREVTFPASTLRGDAYDAWLSHVWTAAACSRPVLLRGHVRYVDQATGEVTGTIGTDDLPDKVIYKPCGNRRATVCPGCAEVYRRDAFHLIRAGLAGGKGIPETVAGHPVVFATFTAPSFGPVHSRPVRRHTCAGKQHCHCKADPCHPRRDAGTCPHGRPLACYRRHSPGDARLGEPLCTDCYDYPAHAVWNNSAAELWRRTKQDIERHLAALARRRGLPGVRVRHGKAAEYQARGAVHFHVLLRLDGVDPADPAATPPPPAGITAADLEDAIRATARTITWTTPGHPASPGGWVIGWGGELDVRPITMRGTSAVTDLAVASYLAKYSTKGTEPAGHASARITPDTIDLYAHADGTHPERLIHACWTLGTSPEYVSLRRWAHMLGFGGHFLTKARRYSITLTALRQARITYRRHQDTGPEHGPIRDQDDANGDTVLILSRLSFTGTGWHTTADALLANSAADQARKRRQAGRDELASEYAETIASEAA